MNRDEIIGLASYLPSAMVDKLAHALEWPYYYVGSADDLDWQFAVDLGLATVSSDGSDTYWTLTDLGRTVARCRIQTHARTP